MTDDFIKYIREYLDKIVFFDFFPKEYEVNLVSPDTLIVDYRMPYISDIPNIKNIKYIKSTGEIKETYFPESYMKKLYDNVLYQITLSLANYLFTCEKKDCFDSIIINGWVKYINRATGIEENSYILSIQINKEEFVKLNLKEVDAKECFRKLKGISCSKLSDIIPVKPILSLNKDDKRFIESSHIQINSGDNLAIMDWEDFEQLIRQVFEKEFNVNGGEVRITQASRDGGVDAIAFDPDPIKGGKIVIQAKRYNNTVGVSAVRDLYGTVLNEGANKGILVTTSDYGIDSYSFAKGKPITLLNGANLLSLLNKHGHSAHIKLKDKH